METLDSWESMCLFSRDVDYAPLVTALRRKGKIVYVAVPPGEKPTALVRSAQSTLTLDINFIRSDVATAKYLMPGGALDDLMSCLGNHGDFTFAVHDKDERYLSLGITHPKEAASRLRDLVSAGLCTKFDARLSA
jgi:hypothetical protein